MMNSRWDRNIENTLVFGLDLLATDRLEGGDKEEQQSDRHAHRAVGNACRRGEEIAPAWERGGKQREPGMEKLSPKLRSTRNSQRIERSTNPNATTYSSYFILPSFLYLQRIRSIDS